MQARWLLVPGRALRRAELAAQARPYDLFFGSSAGAEDGPTGHDPPWHYAALSLASAGGPWSRRRQDVVADPREKSAAAGIRALGDRRRRL
jgi:hypothetical protein